MSPRDIGSLLRRAAELRAQGRTHEAIALYESLLVQVPDLADTWYNLALLRRRAGQFEAALTAYDEAIARGAASPEQVCLNKAVIFSEDLRQPEAARLELHEALRLNPDYVPALLNLGNLAEELGESERARNAYSRVLLLSQHHPAALSRLAGMRQAEADDDLIIPRLREALPHAAHSAADTALLLFALAQRLDSARCYDEAFDTADQAHAANQRAASGTRIYDRESVEQRLSAVRETFASPEPLYNQGYSPNPVFIVGMFRSGSTLVEQILATHDHIGAGGELPHIPRIPQIVRPYPAAIADASRQQLDRLAAAYLAVVRKALPGKRVVTDKRPDNFEHVGMIKRIFPNAKIIYTRRDPLDICVSTHFLHIDPSIAWASSVEDTAHQYVQCTRMMEHWSKLYPEDILAIDYEKLLDDPAGQVRAMLSFLELPPSDAWSTFHTSTSPVRTASVWQVRETFHKRSVGRWQNYERHLADATKLLKQNGHL